MDYEEYGQELVYNWLLDVISGDHPCFMALSEPETLLNQTEFTMYSQVFRHENGKIYEMTWKVGHDNHFGESNILFEPAKRITVH